MISAGPNFLCWTKNLFTYCARLKDDLHSVKLVCLVFEEALNAIKLLMWLKTFGPAQNILGHVKGQGISACCLLCQTG